MPETYLRLPSGRIVPASGTGIAAEAPVPPKRDALRAGADVAISGLRYSLPAAVKQAFGDLSVEDEAEALYQQSQAAARSESALPGGPAQFGRAPFGQFVTENLAYGAPQMGAQVVGGLAGGLAGGAAGSVVPGVGNAAGVVAGSALGVAAVGSPFYVASNTDRALSEGGGLTDAAAKRSLLAAVPQSLLDAGLEIAIPGIGAPLKGGVLRRVAVGAGRAALVEGGTEVAQDAGERYAAGLDLTSSDALSEYGQAALTGGVLGGSVGAVTAPWQGRHVGERGPAPLEGPVDLLALPSPETISPLPGGPTMYVGEDGATSENPGAIRVARDAAPGADLYNRMSALNAAPKGAQADWVSGDYQLPAADTPSADAAPADIGTGQPELAFPASSTVANDFDTTRITRILRGPGKTDGFVAKTAPKLAAALKTNDVGTAQAVLDDATENLKADAKLSPTTVEARQAVLERAQLVVDTYKSRMADAFNQEAATQRAAAPVPATVSVNPAPVEPAVQGYAPQDVTDRNTTMAATDEARRAEVLQRATNTTLKAPVENVFSRMLTAARLDPTVTHEELGQLVEAIGSRDATDGEAAARDAAAAQISTADMEARIPERVERAPMPTASEAVVPVEQVAVPAAKEPEPASLPAAPAGEVAALEAPAPTDLKPTAPVTARQQAAADMVAERAAPATEPAVDTTATEKLIEEAFDRKEIHPTQFTQLKHMLEAKAPTATVEAALADAKALTARTSQLYNTKKRWEPKPDDTIVKHNGKSLNLSAMHDLFQRLRTELTYKGFGDAAFKLVLGDDVRSGQVEGLEPAPDGSIPSGHMAVDANAKSPSFGQRIIRVVADPILAGREMKTLNHEIVHLARDLGVFTDKEWATLEGWARTQRTAIGDINKLYAHEKLSTEKTLEEVIAEAYADWEQSRAPAPPQVRTVFQRLKDFLSTIGRVIKGLPPAQKTALRTYLSFGKDVDTIFSNLSSGAIGDRPRPRFNLSRAAVEGASMQSRTAAEDIKSATGSIATGLLGKAFTTARMALGDMPTRYASTLMLTPSLIDHARRHGLPSAVKYDRLDRESGRMTGTINEQATQLEASYAALPTKLLGKGKGTLSSLVEASTRSGKWAFRPDWLTAEELRGKTPEVDPDLAAQMQAMGPEAGVVAREMFRLTHDTFTQMKQVLDDTIHGEGAKDIKAATDAGNVLEAARLRAQLTRARDHYRTLNDTDMSKPYAPLRRNGNFVVVAKSKELIAAERAVEEGDASARELAEKLKADPAHYFFDAFDSNLEQGRVHALLDARPEFRRNVDMFKKSEDEYIRAGGLEMLSAFRRLSTMLDDALDDVNVAPLKRLLTDLYIQTLSSSSSRKSEMHRLGVDSMPLDMMQNVIDHVRSQAHIIGAMSTVGERVDTLAQMKREAHAKSEGETRADKLAVYNEIMKREADAMKPPVRNALVDNVLAATSSYMLTASPSYYIQQILQNPAIIIPQLAAEHGYAKSWAALIDGYKEVNKAWGNAPLAKPLEFDKLSPRMAELGHYLQAEGQLDVGLNQDLGDVSARSGNPAMQAATTVFSKLRAMVRLIEATSRYSAGVAAFNLALGKGSTAETLTDPEAYAAYVDRRKRTLGDDRALTNPAAYAAYAESHNKTVEGDHVLTPQEFAAAQHARNLISLAHGIYTQHAKPRFMRGPVGRVATQFRVFQILQLTLWADAFSKVLDSSRTPQERLVAKRALVFMGAHTAVLAGALGLPAADLLRALAEGLMNMFGDDDEPADLERSLREAVGDPGVANLLLYGVPSLVGLDMSGSMGASSITSIAPYTKLPTDRRSTADYFTAVFGGPSVAGMGMNYADGLGLMAKGDYYKGLEKFLPKGLGNLMKAGREATDGRTNNSGDVTHADVDAVQTIYTALGLRSTERASEQWALSTEVNRKRFQKDKAGRLKRDYVKAAKDGDTAEMTRLRKEWQDLQAAKPAMERRPLSELLKSPAEQRRRERQTVGGVQYTARTRQRAEELADLTGLAPEEAD